MAPLLLPILLHLLQTAIDEEGCGALFAATIFPELDE
jgi:hypothetical protein